MALPTKELIEQGWLRDALTRALAEPPHPTGVEQFVANIMRGSQNDGHPPLKTTADGLYLDHANQDRQNDKGPTIEGRRQSKRAS